MKPEQLDEIERVAKAAPQGKWELRTSNSWRRVYATDGSSARSVILPAVNHDGHPDLAFAPGVKEWLEGVTPEVVLSLIAEVKRLRKDAERYRWLRKQAHLTDYDGGNTGVWDIRGINGYSTWVGDRYDYRTFDGAVDAARKENPNATD